MIIKFTYILLFIFIETIHFAVTQKDYCYMEDKNPYKLFGTGTAYEQVRAKNIETLPECDAIYMWALIRHGTRFMTKVNNLPDEMTNLKNKILKNHEVHNKRGELCSKDLDSLKQWTYKWNKVMNGELTNQGKLDMSSLAKRLKQTFNQLLSADKNKFFLRSSSFPRCKDSAVAFTNELFGTEFSEINMNNIAENNTLLRSFKNTPTRVHKEYMKFIESKYIQEVIFEVSKRLGFETLLSYNTVHSLYKFCYFETAWDLESRSSFCAAFTPKHLKVLEYDSDMEHYYLYGYGNPENNIASFLIEDLFMKMNDAKNKENNDVATIYFAHSQTLLSLITKLGLHYDIQLLTKNNYESLIENRKWRTSYIDPFAANIIFILYKCNTMYKIAVYENEHITMVLPLDIVKKLHQTDLPSPEIKVTISASDPKILGSANLFTFVCIVQILCKFFSN